MDLKSVHPVAQLCLTLCDPMDCSTPGLPGITKSQSLLKLMIESVMLSNHLILWCLLHLLTSIFPSQSVLHTRWQNFWSFSFSINPSNEYSGLISFMMDWLDLLAVQGTLKNVLQHHSSKASILCRSAFFIVQLSHPYMTTGKITALNMCTFVHKVMSLSLLPWSCSDWKTDNQSLSGRALLGVCVFLLVTAIY